jgi:heme exporter protein C
MVLIFVIPRLTDSLHPGNGGNPGFNQYDLDSRLRMVFYPAVIGWVLLGFWVSEISIRIKTLELKKWTK